MRLLSLVLTALLIATPALALDPMPADGDWDCELRTETLGGINIDGESYRFTRPDGRKRAGDLALELDNVTYYVESGVLREEFGLTNIAYGDEGGVDNLTLSTGDLGALRSVGVCMRPMP